jgi:hypothetical protein
VIGNERTMRSANTLILGILLTAAASGLQAQTKPAATAGAKSAPATAGKSAPQAAKPSGKTTAKSTSKAATKPATKKPVNSAAPDAGAGAPAEGEAKLSRRDPFESLVGRQKAQAEMAKNLPPGKAGLQVSTLRLDGIVRAPNGMIAVVTNPQARTYFLREGDKLFDGEVEKILMDGVSFHEEGKDAFGKPVERQVNKKIYSSAGEQQ